MQIHSLLASVDIYISDSKDFIVISARTPAFLSGHISNLHVHFNITLYVYINTFLCIFQNVHVCIDIVSTHSGVYLQALGG